jgi:hypothetical protein
MKTNFIERYYLKRIYLLFIIFILCHFPIRAQTDSCVAKLASFAKNINIFNHLNPQEKVYLHFDNTGYFTKDTIWFKAYVVTATDIKPTIHSRVLYVDLLTPEGQIVETKRLKVENGQCHGEFALDKYFRAGFYEVRAYTRVMLNYGRETIFSRVFPVYNEPEEEGNYAQRSMREPYKNIEKLREKSVDKPDKVNLSFFPEGGNLVFGLNSKIAFKATDANGQGIDVAGAVYNDRNEEITTFSSTHNGMGIFTFCPDRTRHKVKIYFKDRDYTFPLPNVIPEGYVMTVSNMSKDFLLVQMQKNAICPGDTLGFTVTCRGKVMAFDVTDMTNKQEFILKIHKKDLPTGVNQVTAFTRNGEILAQRMVFVNREDEIHISHKQSKKSYDPFEKVKLDFSIKDSKDNPIETSFSLAVRDAATEIPGHYSENIKSDLLLSSDIKGFIENVDYYFESDDNQHKQALDLLLMTQGWSRYSWRLMSGIEPFDCKHMIEKGIVIDGKVYTEKLIGKKEKSNVEVSMWLYSDDGTASQKAVCITDNEGRFNYLADDFIGKWNLTLETKEKGKTIWTSVPLNRIFSPIPRAYSLLEADTLKNEVIDSCELTTTMPKDARSITQVQILKEVTLRATRNRFTNQDIIYDVEKDIDDLIDHGKDYPPDVFEYLIEKNPKFWFESVQGAKRTGTFRYGIGGMIMIGYDERGNEKRGQLNYDRYTYYRPITEVQKIVVSADKDLWMKFAHQGREEERFTEISVVFAYPFKNAAARSQKGVRITYLNGYSQVKEFYNPDYSKGVIPGDVDYRRTLYWNPNVKTNSLGNASVSFFNNSTCKKMTISAETLTSEGIPIVYKE